MANVPDDKNSHEHDNGKNHNLRNEGFASCALVNANYCYQMSLWWWNMYLYNLHAQVQDQNCECVEQSAIVEDECECCQNQSGLETRKGQMYPCGDCAESIYFRGTPWPRSQGEHSVGGENHPDLIFKGDLISGSSKGAYSNSVNDGCGTDDVNEDDDDSDESSDVEMEVDENFRKFLEQSERHRQEREQRKQELLEENDDYIEVGSVHLNTTTSAPTEQPGLKRKEEMKTLYGKHASKIMALEASLQLNYDRQCDARQPVFWPSIPLKF
ncbi:gem-associated protein 8-like [Pocillopora verrucosa]|uniref:gem-associated protein 8-like n=1 Tax=Pocillopora verrucosa TaxID=203993 RepID=UPI002796F5FC|nr:gem-associated protein 8-like [Pocillopora verrucosa]